MALALILGGEQVNFFVLKKYSILYIIIFYPPDMPSSDILYGTQVLNGQSLVDKDYIKKQTKTTDLLKERFEKEIAKFEEKYKKFSLLKVSIG